MPRKSWWARLPFGVRMAAGTSALLIVIGGGVAGVAALTRDSAKPHVVTAVGDSAVPGATTSEAPPPVPPLKGAVAARARTAAEADRSAGRDPVREPVPVEGRSPVKAQPSPAASAAGPSAGQVVTTRTEVETREIPYPTRTVRDPGLPSGSKRVQTPGVAGEETVRYLVTVTDGRPTDRRLLDSTVTRQPQQEIVALGDENGQKGCPLDFCVPLGRDSTCRHHRRDESGQAGQSGQAGESSQAGGSSQVSVTGNDLALLGGGHGDGEAEGGHRGGHWGGGHGGRGRGRGC